MSIPPENIEDILSDSLEIFGGEAVQDHRSIQYGPLKLGVAPKEGKANTLLADHLFSPALLLAERIERGLIPTQGRRVVELGAGCALPSLLMAALPNPPALVVVTDYPDPIILGNLMNNVVTNSPWFKTGCMVHCAGHEWGQDTAPIIDISRAHEGPPGFDVVIMSDLLHFDSSHEVLLASLASLLARSNSARVYVAAGKYTSHTVCNNFLRLGEETGIIWKELITDPVDERADAWLGAMEVIGLDKAQLGVRKNMCRQWVGQWAPTHLTLASE
ncbi:hypothetical protein BJ138DRAFT_1059336 [Hygrophoropsis aurantiaca]|uniref:Uncharacterized protein n=1 Tax=Hygrophoropsis aurantiaca TaxID=72124 RepID=A0ACB8AK71_9AGAM|nr:hypothetical protein BJ138DRAFT_1059336 [Hygrophoropsis aurantiaca]